MTQIMRDAAKAQLPCIGRGKVTAEMRREARLSSKRLEKYFGKPISTK